jgi:TonB family protein
MSRLITGLIISAGLCSAQPVPQRVVSVPQSPEARQKLEQELGAKLREAPENISWLLAMGAMKREDAAPMHEGDARDAALDEAQVQFERVVAIEPNNTAAFYSLGVIGWMRVFPALRTARAQLSMEPETPGPLRDRAVRAVLNAKYGLRVSDAIVCLERVVALDPQNNEAMGYLNLMYRAKADLEETDQAASADSASADRWVHQALDAARAKFKSGMLNGPDQAPPPPPPPPPPASGVMTPDRIRVGGNVQAANLIQKVEPVYPDLARQARIQGTVRFNATIAKDGTIMNLQVLSGHPLLVQAAVEAVKKWLYKPTMLNGSPVEVITTIDVDFTLPDQL